MIPCPPCVVAPKSQLGTVSLGTPDAFPGATRGINKSGMRSQFLSITLATHSCSEPDNFYGLKYILLVASVPGLPRTRRRIARFNSAGVKCSTPAELNRASIRVRGRPGTEAILLV